MPLSFEIQNQKITEWMQDTEKDIQATGGGMGITHRSTSPNKTASLPKVKGRTLSDGATIQAVAFRFPRTLIYPHTGSGSGQGGSKGSRWTTKDGISKRTKPESLNKMNTGKRKAKPFMTTVLDRKVPVLADVVAETSADIVTANLFKF